MNCRPSVAIRSTIVALFLSTLAACSSAAPSAAPTGLPATQPAATASAPSAPPVELTILGAASLKGALDAMTAAYEGSHPGVTLVVSTDSSAALETKIEQGAPADVFLSADMTNPQKLVDAGLATGAATPFASNVLTVIVPTDNPASITSAADLAKAGVKVIGAGDAVPITKYANQAVTKLAGLTGYPADFVAKYTANLVSKEENVKAVVAKIELGEGDAAIVYVTDAVASTKVKTIALPAEGNVVATYDGVIVKASASQAAAQAFLAWLIGTDGQAILTTFGFGAPVP